MANYDEARDLELLRHELGKEQLKLVSILNQIVLIGTTHNQDMSDIQNISAHVYQQVEAAVQHTDELIDTLENEPENA